MKNKITEVDIQKCIDGEAISNYCNQLEFNSSDLAQSIGSMGLSLANLLKSEYDCVEAFDISSHIKQREAGQLCTIIIQFRISGYDDKLTVPINKQGYDKFVDNMVNVVNLIMNGSLAVVELNRLAALAQAENKSEVAVVYKWGMGKYCKVIDWDYNKIKVRLGKMGITHLIQRLESNELEKIIHKTNWSISIKEFVENYDSMYIHEKLESTIESGSLADILTENMLSHDDILTIIKTKNSHKGVQEFKSVSVINELGTFVAIGMWRVNYGTHTISIKIQDDKVLDIENDRFIVDRDIVERVESRIKVGRELTESLFGSV